MTELRLGLHSISLVVACLVACTSLLSVIMSQFPRQHIRSPLLRSVYNRMLDDQRHQQDPHLYWYDVDTSKLPSDLRDKFVQMHQDEETVQFLNNCYEKADWLFTQLRDAILKYVFSWFLTSTSINGWLRRGSMFIFSHEQLQKLLNITPTWRAENMLDLGAGDGMVTGKMADYIDNVFVTEISTVMASRLQEKGYRVLDINAWNESSYIFDLIGCLNLLDRCSQPISMLHSIRNSLRPVTGRVIVAVVLPFKPYVEVGSSDHKPTERINLQGQNFEEQVTSLVKYVFEPAGFTLEHFTKLPYLCEGDLFKSFFVLTDAVFVLKVTE